MHKFQYTTVDGSIVLVDYVTRTPDEEEAICAHKVVDFVSRESNGYVDIDKCVVVASSGGASLTTAGLLTCTALGIVSDTHKLLVHMSPLFLTNGIMGRVLYNARNASFNNDTICRIHIWEGITSHKTAAFAFQILKQLGIESEDDPRIVRQVVGFMEQVRI